MPNSLIELQDVSVRFGAITILEGVNWDITVGKVYGLIGANGSGKSVLLRTLCGLIRPNSGVVRIASHLMAPRRAYPVGFGISIDGPAFIGYNSGLENLVELARIQNKVSKDQVRKAMRDVGLDPDSRAPVAQYSMGMKQKLSTAQALMENPEVILLDEPFNALDKESAQWLRARIGSLRDEGKTVIFTSHVASDIDSLSDSVVTLERGHLEQVKP